jgi:hypothetical protein
VRQYHVLVERDEAHPPAPANDADARRAAEYRHEEIRRLLLDGNLSREGEWEGTDQVAYLQCELGWAHYLGRYGFDNDDKKASHYFEKALAMGHSRAGFYLAKVRGDGPELDFDRAVVALEQAVKPCRCWTDADCVQEVDTSLYGHKPSSHGLNSFPATELARAYEYSDLGECGGGIMINYHAPFLHPCTRALFFTHNRTTVINHLPHLTTITQRHVQVVRKTSSWRRSTMLSLPRRGTCQQGPWTPNGCKSYMPRQPR